MLEALSLGLTHDEWGSLTPREFSEVAAAYAKKTERELTMLMQAAWFAEYFARQKMLQGPGKYLEEFFGKELTEEERREEKDAVKDWADDLIARVGD